MKKLNFIIITLHTPSFSLVQGRSFFLPFLKHQTGHKDTKAPGKAKIK
jgi:hypothetical protein